MDNKLKLFLCCVLMATGITAFAASQSDSLFVKSGKVLDYFMQGKGEQLHSFLREDLKGQLSISMLDGLYGHVEAQYGKLQKKGTWHIEEKNGHKIYYIDLQFANAPLRFLTGYESNGQLNTLLIQPGQPVTEHDQVTKPRFKEIPVTITTGAFRLPGLLMYPKGTGPFPTVVLVHGSGPMDKDETLGPNKFFLDLANGLAEKGIATLRHDKRTLVYKDKFVPAGGQSDFNTEIVDDVISAIKTVATLPEVNADSLYIAGHSLGGMLLPRIAERLGKKVKGFIGLSAPARSLQQLLPEQLTYIQKVSGNIQATPSSPEIKKEVEAILKTMPASYLKDDATYRPVETAQKTDVSYLFLQGGMDYQVDEDRF